MWYLSKHDIPILSLGAKCLGCGGGGDTTTAALLLQSLMEDDERITVYDMTELHDEFIVPVAMVGSPVLYGEYLPCGDEGVKSLRLFEKLAGKKVEALFSLEIGGMNALVPLITAVQLRLAVVDGDGMGRAFPELHMSPLRLANINLSPASAVDPDGNAETWSDPDSGETSLRIRKWVNESGGVAHVTCYGGTARTIRAGIVPGTLQLSYSLGQIIRMEEDKSLKLERFKAALNNSVYGTPQTLIEGRVDAVVRHFVHGKMQGAFHLNGRGEYNGQAVEVTFHNEFIAMKKEGKVLLTVPDLMMVLQSETLLPCSADDIQEGMSVLILALPAPSILRTKKMLEAAGPEAFGLSVPYRSYREEVR